MSTALAERLDYFADKYNHPSFIEDDPIQVPHRFSRKQDIEIIGLWTAILSWGQRKTIISKSLQLAELMENKPYDFVVNHREIDRQRFLNFRHRTFQPTDALYFLEFFQSYYRRHDTLEDLFVSPLTGDCESVERALVHFERFFCSSEAFPPRTRKHIPSPARKSTCKRLNMFLRWMVRRDDRGVDFGLWRRIQPSQLIIPIDVHVERVARNLGLLKRKQRDWKAALDLTETLKSFDPADPVRYDFALFGMGVLEKKGL
jgi:uncharacterized protein (TIGR02757 family)